MYDRNDMALMFNIALPLILWTAAAVRDRWFRIVCVVLAIVTVWAIIATTSRGGLVALGAVSLATLFRFSGIGNFGRFVAMACVALLLSLAPESYWERMSSMLNPGEDYNITSETGRLQVWQRGWEHFLNHPMTGVGANNFQLAERSLNRPGVVYQEGKSSHNSPLEILAETGLPGLLAWLAMILFCMTALFKAARDFRRSANPEDRIFGSLSEAVALCFLAYLVGGFFLTHGYSNALLQLVALTAGLQLTAERSARRRRPEPKAHLPPRAPRTVVTPPLGDVLTIRTTD